MLKHPNNLSLPSQQDQKGSLTNMHILYDRNYSIKKIGPTNSPENVATNNIENVIYKWFGSHSTRI